MTTHRFKKPKRILAFDPGEVWCGLAAFDWSNEEDIVSESRVLCLETRTLLDVIRYVDFMLPAYVVCEDFRIQSVGHNRFSAGHTLRLIGALEAVTALNPKSIWSTVPPGNAKKEVPQLFGGWYEDWFESFPDLTNSNWRHAQSAWRVMGRFLMARNPKLLTCIHKTKFTVPMKPWLGVDVIGKGDLTAPALRTVLAKAVVKGSG